MENNGTLKLRYKVTETEEARDFSVTSTSGCL